MPSKVLFGGKRRETQILCKVILGGVRFSGYFWGGGRGKSDPWGLKEGHCLGLRAGRWVKPLKLLKACFWVSRKCILAVSCLGMAEEKRRRAVERVGPGRLGMSPAHAGGQSKPGGERS